MACKQVFWDGREAFELTAGSYGALVVPSLGANVLRLWYDHGDQRFEILRTPLDAETLLGDPYAYGIPVLFPANRVADGFYEWEGVRYAFPQNYPNGVHIHGVLHNRPWTVAQSWHDASSAGIRMQLDTRTDEGLRRSFPVDVVFNLEIRLSKNGLAHLFTVENQSAHPFPAGLAYHTAFNIPFCSSSTAGDVRISVPLKARCIDDPVNRLPAGETRDLDALEKRIASAEGAPPLEQILDYLYTARPDEPRLAVVRDIAAGWETVYTAGKDNQYWIIWNATGREGFVAIEPQTWLSNAMKQRNPVQFGAIFVHPGETWTNRTEIALRPCEKRQVNYG